MALVERKAGDVCCVKKLKNLVCLPQMLKFPFSQGTLKRWQHQDMVAATVTSRKSCLVSQNNGI